MLWVLYFESHQKADRFKRVETLIYIVAKENILIALHLLLIRKSEVLEQSKQVMETTVYTSKYLYWWPHSYQARLTFNKFHGFLAESHDFILFEREEGRVHIFLLVVGKKGLNNVLGKFKHIYIVKVHIFLGCG